MLNSAVVPKSRRARGEAEPNPFELSLSVEEIGVACAGVAASFTLNHDQVIMSLCELCEFVRERVLCLMQAAVLTAVTQWFSPAGSTQAAQPSEQPVTLVHGVFGEYAACRERATAMLSDLFCGPVQEAESPTSSWPASSCWIRYSRAVVTLLAGRRCANHVRPCSYCGVQLDQCCVLLQVLIASATNVAVDNVLLGLLGAGFTDFARVGSVKKIAKPVMVSCCILLITYLYADHVCTILSLQILPLTAHSAGAETTKAIADLRFMMNASGRQGVVGAEREAVQEAITKLETKKVRPVCGGVL